MFEEHLRVLERFLKFVHLFLCGFLSEDGGLIGSQRVAHFVSGREDCVSELEQCVFILQF